MSIRSRHGYLWYNFLFDSTQSQKALIHPTITQNDSTRIDLNQLLTQNEFLNLIQIDSPLKKNPEYFDSNQLTTQKTFQRLDLNRLMTQKSIWNIDSTQVMTQLFESSINFVDLFWAFTKISWLFLGFHQVSLIFIGLSLNFVDLFWIFDNCLDSNQLMTQEVSRSLESIQLMTQADFQELTQNQLMTQVDSPGIYLDWLMTQSASPFLYSNQLMTQAKSIWFWVDSCFDSESCPCLIRSEHQYYTYCRTISNYAVLTGNWGRRLHALGHKSSRHEGNFDLCVVAFEWLKIWQY